MKFFSGNDSLLLKLSTETASLVRVILGLLFVVVTDWCIDIKERL